jgi:CBS domain-containing protein
MTRTAHFFARFVERDSQAWRSMPSESQRHMKVRDAMTREVKTCAPETDLAAAARSMWMRNCGILPVVDDKGEVAGVITDRDICIATGCRRRDPATILVSEVMTRQVHSCLPEADICEALQIMEQKQVRRLPVIDSAGKLCGVLSLNDMVLRINPDATAPEPCARDIHAALRSICAHRPKPEEPVTQAQPQPRAQGQKVAA